MVLATISLRFGDADLFDRDILADVLGGEIEKLHDVRAQQGLRQAMAGDGVGREHGVGAGAPHLVFGAFFGGARGDVDSGLRPLAESRTKRLSASVASAATRPRARSMPTRRRVSSRVESAATASMPASMARSTRSGLISTTTKGTPACCNSLAAPRPTRP